MFEDVVEREQPAHGDFRGRGLAVAVVLDPEGAIERAGVDVANTGRPIGTVIGEPGFAGNPGFDQGEGDLIRALATDAVAVGVLATRDALHAPARAQAHVEDRTTSAQDCTAPSGILSRGPVRLVSPGSPRWRRATPQCGQWPTCSHSTIGSCRSPAWHAARYGSFIQPDQLAVGRREERPPLVHEHQRPRHQVTSDMSALGSPDDMRKRGLSNLARPPRLCAPVPKRAAKSVNSGPRGETLIPN